MACPTRIGFYYVTAFSHGAGGAINYRNDGKFYDNITTSSSSSSQCRYQSGEETNWLGCLVKGSGSNGSQSGGSHTTTFTYEIDEYGNIRTIRSDTGNGNSSSQGNSSDKFGMGGLLGASLFCIDSSSNSTSRSNVSLKGQYRNTDSCGGKEYIIKSTGRSSILASTTGTATMVRCYPNYNYGDCSMINKPQPINDIVNGGGPCSSTNGYADIEDVPACGGVVGGYHSGFKMTETPTSTSGSYSEFSDECNNNSSYSQNVSKLSTVAPRKKLASASVDRKLEIADQNSPYQVCKPNKCRDAIFKSGLACYGLTLDNPSSFGENDSLSSAVGGIIIRAGTYANGKLSLGDKTQKVKMYIYYIPCERDEYGRLYAKDSIGDACNCGKKTPITETSPAREVKFSIDPQENITRTYAEDGKTIASEAIISNQSFKFKSNEAAVDTSIQACWIYDE